MARRPRRGLVVLLVLGLVTVACTGGETSESTTTVQATTMSTSPTTTSTPTTTTFPSTTTSRLTPTTLTEDQLADIDAEVRIPEGDGPFPAVVLVHGGGWVGGSPAAMRPLARLLTDGGFLTVNTSYRLATLERPSYPRAVEDVACAVRLAAAHPRSDGTVAIIGHSAGAHLSALVALKGDDYKDNCELTGSGVPEKLVGLAGPYDTDRLGFAVVPFFGQSRNADPALWEEGNPQAATDRHPDLEALIMYGEFDGLVDDSFSFNFHDALVDSGASSLLELVEGARHTEMSDPTVVGDLIVTWLER